MAQKKYIEKVQDRTGSVYHIKDPRIQDLPNDSSYYLNGSGEWSAPENTDTDTKNTVGTNLNAGHTLSSKYGIIGVNANQIGNEDGYYTSCVLGGLYFYENDDSNHNRSVCDLVEDSDGQETTQVCNRITFSRKSHILTVHAPAWVSPDYNNTGVRIDGLRLPNNLNGTGGYHRIVVGNTDPVTTINAISGISDDDKTSMLSSLEGTIWIDTSV